MGDYQGVLDKDFSEVITPKAYRITSSTQYVKAVVTAYEEIIEKKNTQTLLVYRNNQEGGAFTIEYEEGMTWRDWVNSSYNLNPTTNKPYLKIDGEDIYWKYSDGMTGSIHNENEDYSKPEIDDLIINKTYYVAIIA